MNILRVFGLFTKLKHLGGLVEYYLSRRSSKTGISLVQVCKEYEVHRHAYELGCRAAQGKNIYLTFGSEKTISKDAQDSYRRYVMAMKHYNNGVVCNKESFIAGYNAVK